MTYTGESNTPIDIGTYTRKFTMNKPVLFNGQYYPSAIMPTDDGNGNIQDTTVFADREGNYYTPNGQNVILQGSLPEVAVYPQNPTQEEILANVLNSYLTTSNDKTKVNNTSYRKYNTHLNDRTIQGAKSNAVWEKEHPNLSSWGYLAAATPFAIAAVPAAIAGGKAILGTGVGQYARSKVVEALANPLIEMANTGLGIGFGTKAAYNISQGDITPSTLLELAGIYPGIKAAKKLIDKKRFVSELDWTPENWFKTRVNGIYDKDDIKALKIHIPEYHKIEKQAKANGTWLKMSDGSIWDGDPRSWVQLQSKNGRQLMQKPLYHGDSDFYSIIDGVNTTPEEIGKKVLWASTNKNLPKTYGNNHYILSIPLNTNIKSVDAGGNIWDNLYDIGYEKTDDVVKHLLNKNNVVEIKNVIDIGSIKPKQEVLPKAYPKESVLDYNKRVYMGDDIVFGTNVPRKSLLGNNGNFDLLNKNIYKGLLPLGISSLFYNSYDNQ